MSLKKLRQKYPEYNDIPDLKLAEAFYKKDYSDVDETEYYNLNRRFLRCLKYLSIKNNILSMLTFLI